MSLIKKLTRRPLFVSILLVIVGATIWLMLKRDAEMPSVSTGPAHIDQMIRINSEQYRQIVTDIFGTNIRIEGRLVAPEKRDKGWEEAKKILNLLADTVETVTPWLVEGMLNAKEGGEAVRWLTPGKVMRRKLMSYFKKRDVFTPLGL